MIIASIYAGFQKVKATTAYTDAHFQHASVL